MDTYTLFKIFNTAILLPWAMMIFLPRWKWTEWMIQTKLPILIIAAAYFALLMMDFIGGQGHGIDFSDLDSIMMAFSRKEVMLIGWLHYLAFDLFVGMWVLTDAQKIQFPIYLLVPCLILTLMFGPVGFLLYWLIYNILQQKQTM